MARRIAQSTLNASTLDILNVIRANASLEYQSSVPEITQATDIPKVGEVIYGTPAFANQFLNALINRIAAGRIQSANFNNPYSILKKGYLEFGETVEDIFVNIAQVVEYSAEKAESRELKRVLPDVRSAFHVMNWRVMYPLTVEKEQLKRAFLSADGVERLITDLINQIFVAAQYDEFLLFKYMLIKGVNEGTVISDPITATDIKDYAKRFRALSNDFTFLKSEYNYAGVRNNTPKEDQYIFMDAAFNADFDVDVLASAFNMDKADFMGKLLLIDDSIVRGTQLRETVDFLYKSGAKEVHMRSACPPIMYGCKYLNFSRSTSDMDLISRRVIVELEGEEGLKHIDEYADGNSERGKKMRKTICEKFGFASLGFQTVDGVLNAIGLDKCKLCTYCWNGKE